MQKVINLLNSALYCVAKLTFTTKSATLKRSYLQGVKWILGQEQDFQKVHLILFKTSSFCAPFTHVGTRQTVPPPTNPGSAASGSQHSKLNDEPEKICTFPIFVHFFWTLFFTFGQNQYVYLTHSAMFCFAKMTFKTKNATSNGYISTTYTNLESNAEFSESSLIFFKAALFCACFTYVGKGQGTSPLKPLVPLLAACKLITSNLNFSQNLPSQMLGRVLLLVFCSIIQINDVMFIQTVSRYCCFLISCIC